MQTKGSKGIREIAIEHLDRACGGGMFDGFFNNMLASMTGGAMGGYGNGGVIAKGPPQTQWDSPSQGSFDSDTAQETPYDDGNGDNGGGYSDSSDDFSDLPDGDY